ncbi:MAG: hypothetical protein H0T79_17550 [Deltaproteobacteria bacterium]|nr:hypothetical protein [Deltaproteobacteria bacterium]
MRVRIAFLIAGLVGCVSDEAIDGRKRCVALRDHVVELRLQGVPASDLAAHRDAMTRALGDAFVDAFLASDVYRRNATPFFQGLWGLERNADGPAKIMTAPSPQ